MNHGDFVVADRILAAQEAGEKLVEFSLRFTGEDAEFVACEPVAGRVDGDDLFSRIRNRTGREERVGSVGGELRG